ncbi:TetR/AcrR family transcriptional regulator [Halopseudomonas yangmingensis]|uniref:Transcriptional regulator, TetR family n=1 Tax=Halopseudomonas yangmingensis TaxID=1720063 RepID=A0A1I4RWK1_9GAMM|nr:TetR/AcrR family transcriptional regulator [Halopseudomonas yangmingensis]SFM56380.1 transcriptional regulator, TetR family [Halopseudomonas yangmingensis]
MKTRDRILLCALTLFNEEGEPNVTTLEVANELDISPGNLYYHFKGKEALLEALLGHFQQATLGLLESDGEDHAPNAEDLWLLLHLLFERIGEYRFLFCDLSNLMQRYPFLRKAMQHWLGRLRNRLQELLEQLQRDGHLQTHGQALDHLLDALCQTVLFWLDYRRVGGDPEPDPAEAVVQLLSLLQVYLDGDYRDWIAQLTEQYQPH